MIPIIVRDHDVSRSSEFRMTDSRLAILDEVRGCRSHPTADDVYARVRLRLPRISMGTVYRNLDLLVRHGLVRTLTEPGGRRRYDAVERDHDHVWCVSCGRVDDVNVSPSMDPQDAIEDARGYEIRGRLLSFYGVCPECRASNRSSHPERGGGSGSQGYSD